MRRRAIRWESMLLLPLLVACGEEGPRFGSIRVSTQANKAELSGVTAPTEAAVSVADGCAGHINTRPEHQLVFDGSTPVSLTARSEQGPLVLLLRGQDKTRCDTDGNEGLRPSLTVEQAGTYALFVGSLESMEQLPYRLTVRPADAPEEDAPRENVISVSVSSEPVGAAVTSPGGEYFGVTPTVLLLAPGQTDARVRVSLGGYKSQELQGTAEGDNLRLHATLEPAGPKTIELSATEAVPIRDFRTVSQQLTVEEGCTIAQLEADVAITHSYVADLLVTLSGPGGVRAVLHRGGRGANIERTYNSKQFRALRSVNDGQAQGTWTLSVKDREEEDQGSLESFTLRITCKEMEGG